MADQWIVAYHADMTLNVDAVGPFRSQARAEAVAERLMRMADARAAAADDGHAHAIPHVVRLRSLSAALDQLTTN